MKNDVGYKYLLSLLTVAEDWYVLSAITSTRMKFVLFVDANDSWIARCLSDDNLDSFSVWKLYLKDEIIVDDTFLWGSKETIQHMRQ